jgi:hypothetical protein
MKVDKLGLYWLKREEYTRAHGILGKREIFNWVKKRRI